MMARIGARGDDKNSIKNATNFVCL